MLCGWLGGKFLVSPWAVVAFVGQYFSSHGEKHCCSQSLFLHDMTPPSLCLRSSKGAAALPETCREGGRGHRLDTKPQNVLQADDELVSAG